MAHVPEDQGRSFLISTFHTPDVDGLEVAYCRTRVVWLGLSHFITRPPSAETSGNLGKSHFSNIVCGDYFRGLKVLLNTVLLTLLLLKHYLPLCNLFV